MKKLFKKSFIAFLIVALFFVGMNTNSFAAELTADFVIEPELWKCIVETSMFNYDDNDDGVVTKDEFGDAYGFQINCEGYDIKDWSALQYGAEWQMLMKIQKLMLKML